MASIHPETELIPYLREELSADERARVRAHLEGCAQCRESALASSTILSNLARAVDEVREPNWTDYRAELKRKLRASQARKRDHSRPLAMAKRGRSIACFWLAIDGDGRGRGRGARDRPRHASR